MQKLSELTVYLQNFNIREDYHLLLIGAGLLIVFFLIIKRLRRKKPEAIEIIDEPEKDEVVATGVENTDEIGEDSIVEFFLGVYKAQIGAPKTAQSSFKLLKSKSGVTRQTFELKVLHPKDWVSRRMSLSTLGGESGSSSKCYYIIYDDHLVMKIPRKAITDFEHYLDAIIADQQIVNRLSPRECIVPSVSSVLKLVHPLSRSQDLSPIQVEEKYQSVVKRFKNFQDFFRIQNTYVFVMDLSKYFFLSQIIDDMHNLEANLYNDITGYPDVIWENHGFEGRYGFEKNAEVESIKDVYRAIEGQIKAYVKKIGREKSVGGYQFRSWFLKHLAGRQIDRKEKDLTDEQISTVNKLFAQTLEAHADSVQTYLDTIRGCIQSVTVQQNKHQIGGLVTNILDLLTWLREKKVAVRDLKPDNLLVAGDQNRYPQFLDSFKNYTVGLIDVETAVDYAGAPDSEILQPILGGTPSYATPSHLYTNGALDHFFNDCKRILYMQDWYAAVGMIYEVIVGQRLFNQTGKLIVGIKNMTIKPDVAYEDQFELFIKTSRMFWHSARKELTSKMEVKENLLRQVSVYVPDETRELLGQDLRKEVQILSGRIKKLVASQSVIKGEKNCQGLIRAPRAKISQLKAKWRNNLKAGQGTENQKQVVRVLHNLEKLKTGAEQKIRLTKLVSRPKLTLSAYDLLVHLFDMVQDAMYRQEWGEPEAASVVGVGDDNEGTTIESTV